MRPSDIDEEPFDFKPFFDMIVGVLFVLLILIAAQMFFARHEVEMDRASEARAAAAAADALHAVESKALLDRIAAALSARGLTPLIAYDRRMVSAPWPRQEQAVIAAQVAQVLMETAACAALATAGSEGCPAYKALRLERLSLEITSASRTTDPEADVARQALDFAASMFAAHPELLRMRSTGGGFVLPATSVVGVAKSGGSPASVMSSLSITLDLSRGP